VILRDEAPLTLGPGPPTSDTGCCRSPIRGSASGNLVLRVHRKSENVLPHHASPSLHVTDARVPPPFVAPDRIPTARHGRRFDLESRGIQITPATPPPLRFLPLIARGGGNHLSSPVARGHRRQLQRCETTNTGSNPRPAVGGEQMFLMQLCLAAS